MSRLNSLALTIFSGTALFSPYPLYFKKKHTQIQTKKPQNIQKSQFISLYIFNVKHKWAITVPILRPYHFYSKNIHKEFNGACWHNLRLVTKIFTICNMLKTFVLHIWKESSASQLLVRGNCFNFSFRLSVYLKFKCVISLLTLREVLMGNGTACL